MLLWRALLTLPMPSRARARNKYEYDQPLLRSRRSPKTDATFINAHKDHANISEENQRQASTSRTDQHHHYAPSNFQTTVDRPTVVRGPEKRPTARSLRRQTRIFLLTYLDFHRRGRSIDRSITRAFDSIDDDQPNRESKQRNDRTAMNDTSASYVWKKLYGMRLHSSQQDRDNKGRCRRDPLATKWNSRGAEQSRSTHASNSVNQWSERRHILDTIWNRTDTGQFHAPFPVTRTRSTGVSPWISTIGSCYERDVARPK